MRLGMWFLALTMAGALLAGGCSQKDDNKQTVEDTSAQDQTAPVDAVEAIPQDTAADTVVPDGESPEDTVVPTDTKPADTTETVADVVEDTATDTATPDTAQEVAEDVVEDVVPSVTGTITVKVGEATTVVDLSTLETTDYQGLTAVRLTRIVEKAAIALPYNYHYNFIAGDGFNVLVEKMEGNYAKLPWYKELDLGFVYYDAEKDMLRVGWDESLAFPGSLNVKGIGGGTIEAIQVEATKFVFISGTLRALLDTTTLPKVDVVDYKHPEDGAKPMISFAEIFKAADSLTPDLFAYKFYGSDGFSNNDANLMPYANTQHGYYEPVKRRIILEEGWDTTECCWSVKETVLILGLPVVL